MRSVWQNFQDGVSHCSECPGQEAPYPLGGIGNHGADVMLVGQEPAYNVDDDTVTTEMNWLDAVATMIQNRRDSMNPLWKHMMNVAVAAECSPTDLYFTNISKCSTDNTSFSDCLEHCRGYFPREVAQVDPDVMLLYGGKVISTVFDMFDIEWSGSVGDVHGEIHETSSLKLAAFYHWGYIYRQGDLTSYREEVTNVVQDTVSAEN
jgi:uracil-DNA glycosylase